MKKHHYLRLTSLLLLLGLLTSCYSSKKITKGDFRPLRKNESISKVYTTDHETIKFLTNKYQIVGAVIEGDTLIGITEDYRFTKVSFSNVQSLKRMDPETAGSNAIIAARLKNGENFTFLTKSLSQGAILKEDLVVGFSKKGIPIGIPWRDVQSLAVRQPDAALTTGAVIFGTISGIIIIGGSIVLQDFGLYQ